VNAELKTMNQKYQYDSYLSATRHQHMEDDTSSPSSTNSNEYFLDDAEEAGEVAFIDLTADEEGAMEELPRVDVIVEDKHTHINAMMNDPKDTPQVDPNVDEEVRPKALPRVDVDIDEDNIDTDEEQLEQEAPVPEPFDIDDEDIEPNREQLKQNTTVPDADQTAENGWIVILQNHEVPYDQDVDPAGLYGGKEVDDRPTLLQFYHQDARTNGHFAKMAPTKAELVAEAVASRLAEAESKAEEAKLVASRLAFTKRVALPPTLRKGSSTEKPGILKLRPPNGDIPSPSERSYADVLTSVYRTSAPFNETNILPSRSVVNVSFSPGTKGKSAKEKVMKTFHKWQRADNAKPNDNAQADCWKALRLELDERDRSFLVNSDDGGPLHRTNSIRTWVASDPKDETKRVLRITNPDLIENADDEMHTAKSSIEVDDDADSIIAQPSDKEGDDPELEKAIAASLAQHKKETKGKGNELTDLKENIHPDIRKTLDASVTAEIKANEDFHKQLAEIDLVKSMAITDKQTAGMRTLVDASKAKEEADLERAIWESIQGSPVRKRKTSSQSLLDDGPSEESETWRADRGWWTPKGGEKRNHKRCKRVPLSELQVEGSDTHAVSSPRKIAEE